MNFNNQAPPGVFSFSLSDLMNGNGAGTNDANGTTGRPINGQFAPLNVQDPGASISAAITSLLQNIGNIGGLADTDTTISNERKIPESFLKSLKPVNQDEIPEGIELTDSCAICYDPYLPSEETAHEFQDGDIDMVNATDAATNNMISKFFEGYEVDDDPSIAFPAIETATYQHSYIPSVEQEYQSSTDDQTLATGQGTEDHFAVMLPLCKHIFGKSCIVEWLKSNTTCPLCRQEVLNDELFEHFSNMDNQSNNPSARSSSSSSTERTFVYNQAITETYIPIDWTAPFSSGYILSDPPLTMPVPGVGMSTGRRTGIDPPAVS